MNVKLLSAGLLPALLAASLSAQQMTTELVASGLSIPLDAKSPPGDFERIFIAERDGSVFIKKKGVAGLTLFKQIPGILAGGEQGLLGIAFHPDFQNNGYFYASFTRSGDGANVIDRWTAVGDGVASGSRVTVFGPVNQTFSNHNGGCIQFGPDGYLYFGIGDGGSGGDPNCEAQTGTSLLGKMLRLDVDSGLPASFPPSNPFVGDPSVNSLVWALGLRNPWRFSFDRETGDLWIGDVGQNTLEELNFQPASSTGGENYGWKVKEGTNCFSTSSCPGGTPLCASPTLTDPVRTLPTSSNNSIIGGYRYRGCAMPGRHGLYFHGNYGGGKIWTAQFNGTSISNVVNRTSQFNPSGSPLYSFGEDYDGEILLCLGSTVRRVIPVGSLTNSDAGAGSVGSNGETPIYEACGTLGTSNTVTFRVRKAPANSIGAVLFSLSSNPVPLPLPGFGTLVPSLVAFTIPLNADADGIGSWSIADGALPFTLFHQAAFIDLPLNGVTLSNAFETEFGALPAADITSIAPESTTVGQTVTISGNNFVTGGTLDIDGNAVTPISVSSSTITFAMPAGVNCDATVNWTNPDLSTDSIGFNPSPNITGLPLGNPGSASGNVQLFIQGTGFTPGSTVDIGGNAASITSISPTLINCFTPAGTVGPATLTVTSPSGCSDNTTYTYN